MPYRMSFALWFLVRGKLNFLNFFLTNPQKFRALYRFEYDDDRFCRILDKINYRASESQVEFISPFVICETLAKMLQVLPDVKKFKVS